MGEMTPEVRDAAVAIRAALYRACPEMPSYPAGVVEPILAGIAHSATPSVDGERPFCQSCASPGRESLRPCFRSDCAGSPNYKPAASLSPRPLPTREEVEKLAETLCDAPDPRLIAKAEDEPLFVNSRPDVQYYWRQVAKAALLNREAQS